MDLNNYDDLRPYEGEEIPAAIERLLKKDTTFRMMQFVYPDLEKEEITEMLRSVRTTEDFQIEVSAPAFKVVAQTTTNGLTFSNMDSIKKGVPYLFLSNHRDIILDSALLNVSLLEKGFETTQIAIGDNLLKNEIIEDIVRLNKSFIVHRNAAPKELLMLSRRLSNYIRKTITQDGTSVWIAHKEGRSKDGDDRTASGLIKMLQASSEQSFEDGLGELNIIPTVVSYEYDPCDIFKANELLMIKEHGEYQKQDGEDYRSALKGITGHKGRVNIALGNVLNRRLDSIKTIENKNEKVRVLSNLIDQEMHLLYRLWPTNYIAYDILTGENTYSHEYTRIQRITFNNYLRGRTLKLALTKKKLLKNEGFTKQVREVMLKMYANPVINKRKAEQEKSAAHS